MHRTRPCPVPSARYRGSTRPLFPSRPPYVDQADRHSLTYCGSSPLDGLSKDAGILRIEKAFELAAAGVHTLGHFAFANTFFFFPSFGDFPRKHTLPGNSSDFLVNALLNEKLIKRGPQMLISRFLPRPNSFFRFSAKSRSSAEVKSGRARWLVRHVRSSRRSDMAAPVRPGLHAGKPRRRANRDARHVRVRGEPPGRDVDLRSGLGGSGT